MSRLKDFITHNWFAKLFSLAIATMLWITIAGETNSEVGMVVPLEYRNIPPHSELAGDSTNTVEVRLRGAATLIKEMSARDISATVDLSSMAPGEKVVQLTPQNVRAPFGIEIIRVNPSQVRLSLERTITKRIQVIPRQDGEAAQGAEVFAVTATPATVEIQGPDSKVREMESIPTAVVRVNKRGSSFNQLIELDVADPAVRLLYLAPVDVHVGIREKK